MINITRARFIRSGHVCARAHVCIKLCTCGRARESVCACVRKSMRVCAYARLHVGVSECMYTGARKCVRVCVRVCVHACAHVCVRACVCECACVRANGGQVN